MKTKQQSRLLGKLLFTAGVSSAALGLGGLAMDAVAGIANTKHNLTLSTNENYMSGGATAEICVFCHTPHGADTSAPVPLWNKALNSSTTNFTTYESLGTSTLDAKFATDGVTNTSGTSFDSVGSVSLACLSCHDGTQAMDNIINAPGSGGYDSTGGGTGGRTATTWNWTQNAGGNVSTAGLLSTADVTLLGRDLRNDHPIGIQYCGGWSGTAAADGEKSTDSARDGVGAGGTCVDRDFTAPTYQNGKWWVETGATFSRDKSDMVLYSRNFSDGKTQGSVECASCHDPHVETKASNQVAFLRVTQAQSGVCLACHVK